MTRPNTAADSDQLTFQNPVTRYSTVEPPIQHQPEPGLDAELEPKADHGESSYRGTGRLNGRKALITGGDSGIGAAVAIAFAREGADVALNYLPDEHADADRIREIIEREGRTAVLLPGDLTDKALCASVVSDAVDALGGLDILVNNAGKQVVAPSLEELPDEQLTDTYAVNILAMFRITKAALAHLTPGSTIINTTSIEAYQPAPNLLDYASAKAAINNFTKGLAQQLATKGIRVNAVAPGPIWTPLQVSDGQEKEDLPKFDQVSPMGRAGQPTELAPAYVFFTSSESSYVIGETLHVNGGMPTP
ncbi:SDR family oxidoreductase [Dietzia aurantiaca]|uniref:SDR family oxidoreductase n=1 Tax=Dietzia aurantiaca TaxID=983873 RepID=UPI001E5E073A|nr:SDR family oxidoreductase [Dietzia aurantiaca]MCD2261922.1 SDR family oxidoreductase [Dietzia aurantiaca]